MPHYSSAPKKHHSNINYTAIYYSFSHIPRVMCNACLCLHVKGRVSNKELFCCPSNTDVCQDKEGADSTGRG